MPDRTCMCWRTYYIARQLLIVLWTGSISELAGITETNVDSTGLCDRIYGSDGDAVSHKEEHNVSLKRSCTSNCKFGQNRSYHTSIRIWISFIQCIVFRGFIWSGAVSVVCIVWSTTTGSVLKISFAAYGYTFIRQMHVVGDFAWTDYWSQICAPFSLPIPGAEVARTPVESNSWCAGLPGRVSVSFTPERFGLDRVRTCALICSLEPQNSTEGWTNCYCYRLRKLWHRQTSVFPLYCGSS